MTAPIFAVVGRANKGKSSIVAALAEDDRIEIGPLPGTTTRCAHYPVTIDGEVIFELVDTPGFEDAPRALAWLRAHEVDASSRARVVADFVRAHEGRDEFGEECKLLRPILEGASILYVVDGAKPYRQNYEAEMEILRWTGQPGMALINRVGAGDHSAEWRPALDQYFKIVRDFDAFRVSFTERMRVLSAFRELRPQQQAPIARAVRALRADRSLRREETARVLTNLLVSCLTFTLEISLSAEEPLSLRRPEIERGFLDALRAKEDLARRDVETLYKYDRPLFTLGELERPVFEDDLFADRTWQLFGLDATQLVAAYTISGALVGGAIDLVVGGHSFLLGTAIGTVLGAGAGLRHAVQRAGGEDIFEVGKNLWNDKTQRRVGPLTDLNFPFILLDRALLHYRSTLARTHAQREVVQVGTERLGLVSSLSLGQRTALTRIFQKIRKTSTAVPDVARHDLHQRIRILLDQFAPEADPSS